MTTGIHHNVGINEAHATASAWGKSGIRIRLVLLHVLSLQRLITTRRHARCLTQTETRDFSVIDLTRWGLMLHDDRHQALLWNTSTKIKQVETLRCVYMNKEELRQACKYNISFSRQPGALSTETWGQHEQKEVQWRLVEQQWIHAVRNTQTIRTNRNESPSECSVTRERMYLLHCSKRAGLSSSCAMKAPANSGANTDW